MKTYFQFDSLKLLNGCSFKIKLTSKNYKRVRGPTHYLQIAMFQIMFCPNKNHSNIDGIEGGLLFQKRFDYRYIL